MNDKTHQAAATPAGAASVLDVELERLARDSGFIYEGWDAGYWWTCAGIDIAKFAAAVAAKEREACAKACAQLSHIGSDNQLWMRDRCVAVILARSNAELTRLAEGQSGAAKRSES